MICPSCRAQIEDGSNECGYCGYSFIPSHSRQAAGRSSKVDYDLNQLMQDHLERNGHSEAADPPEHGADPAEPTVDKRRIVAPPPADRRYRPAQTTQQAATGQPATHPEKPVQPLEVDISSQKQLPRVDSGQQSIPQKKGIVLESAHTPPQRYTTHKPTASQHNDTGQSGQRNNRNIKNNQTADPSLIAQQLSQQGAKTQPPMVVGASEIRRKKHNEASERKPGAYYSATVENRAVQKPREHMTNRELAEQLAGEVMAKLSQPKKPQTPPVKQPIEQPEAPAMHRPHTSYGADLFENATYKQLASAEQGRPTFGQRSVQRQPQQEENPQQQETYGFGFETPMDDGTGQINASDTTPEGYGISDEHTPSYGMEDIEAGKYASPMLGPEVYQSDIYVASDVNKSNDKLAPDGFESATDEVPRTYSLNEDLLGFSPEGDDGVADEVPLTYSLQKDLLGFAPEGDDGVADEVPSNYSLGKDLLGFAPEGDDGVVDEVPRNYSLEKDLLGFAPMGDDGVEDSGEFPTIDEADIPDPDVFISAGSEQMNDIIPDTRMDDTESDFLLSDDDSIEAVPETLRYDSSATYAQPILKEDDFSSHHFDQAVDSDDAPTQPVSRTFHESPLAKEEKSRKKPIWLLIGLLAVALVLVIGYSLNLWISRSYGSFDNMINALFGGSEPTISILPKEFEGSSVHELMVKSSVEGELIIENFNRRVPFVGGVASAVIYDNVWLQEWIREYPDDNSAKIMTKPLTMYILKSNDERIDLPAKTYEVVFPQTKASIEFENDSKQTSNDQFEIYVIVEPGISELMINGENMIGAVADNRLKYVAKLVPGPNTFEVFARTKYCRAYKEKVTINKIADTGNPSSPLIDDEQTGNPESTTVPGEQSPAATPTDSGGQTSLSPNA